MATFAMPASLSDRLRTTEGQRHMLVVRAITGAPLLGIGIAHVVAADAPMRPLVDAAGIPLAAVVAPLAVAIEVVAGLSLLLGWWARIGAVMAIPTMLGAVYAHLVIDLWPNPSEPPLALPVAVMAGAAYVLWRGAGRWSVDLHAETST